MTRIRRSLALASLGLSLMACGTSKYYTLPADPSRISETQTYIGACATQLGLQSEKHDNTQTVRVEYDADAAVYYQYNEGDHLNMQVVVDDKKVPPGEMQQKFNAVKARGDEIYACAQSRLQAPMGHMAPVEHMAPAPSASSSMNMNANASLHGNCARAVECYAQLARVVCTQGASDCSFKVEISGNDDEGCREALLQVPNLLQPFRMMQPGLNAPAVCRAE
ncbi:hypothetical protein [Melittangium boletus]|uniref:hypothetical protein n=1 Tax=Melittangium boletus TaxID=83453 RepID=UPI003DA564E2